MPNYKFTLVKCETVYTEISYKLKADNMDEAYSKMENAALQLGNSQNEYGGDVRYEIAECEVVNGI